jgi:transcriptional regulator with XRE-family HTH domain
MASVSPTVRRRELGARLRALRLASGLTAEDVAARMEVSPAKISRIETGARGVSIADVRFLCDLYGVSTEERDRLLTLTRESKRRSWWQQYGLPESLATYIGLEDAAVSIQQYETSIVPPLLQTEEYAHALVSGAGFYAVPEQEQLVQARMTRQEILTASPALQLWAVIDEAALHRMVGGPEVTRAQLQALAERSRAKNITLQVIPFAAGAHPGLNSSFIILHLEEVQDVVYVEGLIGNFYLQSPADIVRYRRTFDELRAVALGPQDSRKLIDAVAGRLGA